MDEKIDVSGANLILDGTPEIREEWVKKIDEIKETLNKDQAKRNQALRTRYDFYTGQQEDYTTIAGKRKTQKEGHANAVNNYAGRSAKKIIFSMVNSPPAIDIPGRSTDDQFVDTERARANGVEQFTEDVFKRNRFWYRAYVRGSMNQGVLGDACLKTYPFNKGDDDWDIKITNVEKMENVRAYWRGDDVLEYDCILVEEERTIKSLENEFGVKIPESMATGEIREDGNNSTDWAEGKNWGNEASTRHAEEKKGPSLILQEYDDLDYYILKIGSQIIEFVEKDDETYPKFRLFTLIPNIPQPRSPWSISDLDDMMDPQIAFNEAANDERDYIRVGAAQKFVAYNMPDFDPESMKTGSGGVIFVDNTQGNSRFEPLTTNVNVFPVDQFLNRTQATLYDMGVPKVAFGAGGADSGRSKAIDYQSLVDLIAFKRKMWEDALTEVILKIQILGDFYYGEIVGFFKDPKTDEFVLRYPEFDWEDVTPITRSDLIVNVLNKVQMGLPFRFAFKELGYRDTEAVIEEIRRESKDEDLMAMRSKMYQVTPGIVSAVQRAQELVGQQEQIPPTAVPGAPEVNTPGPTFVPSQNDSAQPAAVRGGTQSFTSPQGFLARTRQNLEAGGR